jgi:hypothetical protein
MLLLCRARKEAAEVAEVARLESVAALKSELAELKVRTYAARCNSCHQLYAVLCCSGTPALSKVGGALQVDVCMAAEACHVFRRSLVHSVLQSQLSSLQDAHASQLSSQQEASARQLAQQLKTADAIIKELEGAAVSLQNQLTAEVERADGYSRELQRYALNVCALH